MVSVHQDVNNGSVVYVKTVILMSTKWHYVFGISDKENLYSVPWFRILAKHHKPLTVSTNLVKL